jgi:LysM repeat protein
VIRWADIILFAVIGGLLVLWWTHPPATASIRLPATVEPAIAPSPDLAWLPEPPTPLPGTVLPSVVPTVTPVPPTATPVQTPRQHKVAYGESVGLIAEKYDIKVKDLVAFNDLSSNGFIVPGQILKIPRAGLPNTSAPTSTPTGGTLIYTVKQGDSFAGLADRFHTDMDLILSANNMKQGDFLAIGKHLLIPLSADTPVPTPTATGTPPPPTFTPQVDLRVPNLLLPADGAKLVDSDQVMLSWTTVGLLNEDQWYVVFLTPAGAAKPAAAYWTKATSWRLTPDDRAGRPSPTDYSWYVQVLTGKPGQANGARPSPANAPSAVRYFTW